MSGRKPRNKKKAPVGTLVLSLGLLASVAANIYLMIKYEDALFRISLTEKLKDDPEDKSEPHYDKITYRDLVESDDYIDFGFGVETPNLIVKSVSSINGKPDLLQCYAEDPSQSVSISCPDDYQSGLYKEGDIINVKGIPKEAFESFGYITPHINADEITYVGHTTLETAENTPNTLTFEEYVNLCTPLDAEKAINSPAEYRDAYVWVTGTVVTASIDSMLGSMGVVEVQILSDDGTRHRVSYYRTDDAYHSFTLGQKVTFYAQLNGNTVREDSSGYRLTPDISAMYYTIG